MEPAAPEQTISGFSETRAAALIAFIGALTADALPLRSSWLLLTTHGWPFGLLSAFSFLLFGTVQPAFYFGLFRNRMPLRIPKPLRLLAIVAALLFAALVAPASPQSLRQPEALMGEFGNLGYMVLLVALARDKTPATQDNGPASQTFRRVTKIVLFVFGAFAAFLYVPYVVRQLRPLALQAGRTPPSLAQMMTDGIRLALTQSCLLVAPYVVFRRLPRSWRHREAPPCGAGSSNGAQA
ncbi:MAG TPA: hypothetical protein VIY49_07515 [Bryobacteraceae bacterium]